MTTLILQVCGGLALAGLTGYISLRAKAWRIRSVLKGDPDFKLRARLDTIKEDGFPLVYDAQITKIRLTKSGWGSRVWIVGKSADSGNQIMRAWTILKFMKLTRLYARRNR